MRPIMIIFLGVLFSQSCSLNPASNVSKPESDPPQKIEAVRGGELRYRVTAPPSTFNYLVANDEASIIISLYMLTSRLVEFDHKSQKFVAGLAESWTVGADARTVDIRLREGLQFSDSAPLTSGDVIFTLDAIYDEKTEAAAFRDSMLVDGQPIATKRIDDRNLQMIFPRAVASVENYLINLGVLPEHILGAAQRVEKLSQAWKVDSAPAQIVSSGPFVVASSIVGERIEFARNPHYWRKDEKGQQLPYLDKLTVVVNPDANKTFLQLGQGTLDLADRIRPSDYAELSKTVGPVRAVNAGPGLGIDHLWFNLNTADRKGRPLKNQIKRAWFADTRFRRAISAAVDRESIASGTLQGLASPLSGFVSPANKFWAEPGIGKIAYDLAGAERLLTEAGFKKSGAPSDPVLVDGSSNPVEFTLIVPIESEPRKLIAAVLQQDLSKLGIKMQIAPLEFGALTRKWAETYDYDAVLLGISMGDTEPSSFQSFLVSSGELHQWQPDQKTPSTEWEGRIDKLFLEQAVERDQNKRLALFVEIQTIIRDEMPVIPIVARHLTSAARSNVGNYSPSGILPYSLWNVEELYVMP